MNIEKNATFEVANLVSIRVSGTQAQIAARMQEMAEYVKSCGAMPTGLPITAMHDNDAATQTADMEFLVPLDGKVATNGDFVFVPQLHINNCVKLEYKGHPQFLEQSMAELHRYMSDNNMTAASASYNVPKVRITRQEDLDKFEADVYIAVDQQGS